MDAVADLPHGTEGDENAHEKESRGGVVVWDVVIVGGGPSGLMLACELSLAGVRPVVLERLAQPPDEIRANGLVGQVVRMLDRRGLYQRLTGDSDIRQPAPRFFFGALPLDLATLDDNPFYLLPVPQLRLQQVLDERAAELGVHVRYRHGDDRSRHLRRPGGVMMFHRPSGSDRSPQRKGVHPVSATPTAVFCERWHDGEHCPSSVISEAAARRRNGRGQPYMVVLGDQRRPDALIEVNWSLHYLGTWFLDDKVRRNLKYSFTRVDAETLFLEQIILWEYPEDAVLDLHTATRITTLTYNQDGVVHEAIDDSVAGTEEVSSRSDVQLDINWEQVPEFGDWSRVVRWDREGC